MKEMRSKVVEKVVNDVNLKTSNDVHFFIKYEVAVVLIYNPPTLNYPDLAVY